MTQVRVFRAPQAINQQRAFHKLAERSLLVNSLQKPEFAGLQYNCAPVFIHMHIMWLRVYCMVLFIYFILFILNIL